MFFSRLKFVQLFFIAEHIDKMDQTFFALSRDNAALLTELNLCFPPGASEDVSHRFDWQRGEFCAFLVQQFTSTSVVRLIFGRDVFGRKSLCWRVISRQLPAATKNGNTTLCPEGCAIDENACGGTFQLSVLPGRLSDGENDDTDGWEEVPPGNIILLTLPPFSTLKTVPNAKMMSSTTTLLDLHCHLPSMNTFLSQTLCVYTFYPHDYVNENCLFKTFRGSTFTTAAEAEHILLGTSEIGTRVTDLLDNAQISAATEEFVSRFASALQGILLYVPRFVDSAKSDDFNSGFDVSVLFSGGVDSLMVALMAGEVLFQQRNGATLSTKHGESGEQQLQQPWAIRLFSVAFGDNEKDFNEATDRAQSIAAYEYLKSRSVQKYGFNAFSLVLVNVDRDELIECRHRHIAEAIAPSKTVLDDSIGCVLWFASRMKGVDFDTGQEIIDKTPFALVGSGSDEQLGGYARHQTVFKSKGLQGLATELSMEMHRIGARNFGRDDRIGTANGKSILAPFLEEPFVRWLNTLPTALKTGFGLPNGAPNKFLLRNALRFLGVPEYFVQRPKRAMQFGTRMVKMEATESGGAKLKGHQMCKKLLPRNGSANANDGEGRPMLLSD